MMISSVTVFVVFISATFAYSNNPGITSTNFEESQTTYQDKNIQNGYPQLRPDFQNERAPTSNEYSKTKITDYNKRQPSPIKYNNGLGPTPHYPAHSVYPNNPPNSAYPTYPASQQKTQGTNHPDVKLYPQASSIHDVTSDTKLKSIYTALKPTKKYTIIHANGTVEYTDELHSIAERYPNYELIKADDILSQNREASANIKNAKYLPPTAPYVQRKNQAQNVQQPIGTTYQNLETNRINQNSQQPASNFKRNFLNTRYNQRVQNPQIQKLEVNLNQIPFKSSPSPSQYPISISNPHLQKKSLVRQENINNGRPAVPQNTLMPVVQKPIVPPKSENKVNNANLDKNVFSNAAATSQSTRQAEEKNQSSIPNTQQTQNNSKIKLKNTSLSNNQHEDVVPGNPTPFYPIKTPQMTTTTSDKPYMSPGAKEAEDKTINVSTVTLPKQHQVLSLENNDKTINPPIIKSVEEALVASNSNTDYQNLNIDSSAESQTPVPPKSISNLPIQTKIHETLPVILPQDLSQNTLNEVETPTKDTTIPVAKTPNSIEVENSADPNKNTTSTNILETNNNKFLENTPSKNPLNESKEIIQSKPTSINNTEINEVTKEHVASSQVGTVNLTSSVFNDSSKSVTPWTWFNLPDEALWEAIRNNSQNTYFFFLPPKPKISKEIKTTIFPNGTIIEVITETELDIDQGEERNVTTKTRVL